MPAPAARSTCLRCDVAPRPTRSSAKETTGPATGEECSSKFSSPRTRNPEGATHCSPVPQIADGPIERQSWQQVFFVFFNNIWAQIEQISDPRYYSPAARAFDVCLPIAIRSPRTPVHPLFPTAWVPNCAGTGRISGTHTSPLSPHTVIPFPCSISSNHRSPFTGQAVLINPLHRQCSSTAVPRVLDPDHAAMEAHPVPVSW